MKTRRTRDVPIMFYVSRDEKDVIIDAAKSNDMTVSDFCRKTLLGSASYLSCKKDKRDV